MAAVPVAIVIQFALAVLLQLIALPLLAMSQGFTKPLPTAGCLLAFAGAFWFLARIVDSGYNLGVLIPILSAIVPLVSVIIGVVILGETASVGRIAVLCAACILVGIGAGIK